MASQCGRPTKIDRVWVGSFLDRIFKRFCRQRPWERALPDRKMRGCFRVFSSGTNVTGVGVRQSTPVGRCLSIADASLSLSLSLSCPSSTPPLTAKFGRFSTPLAGYGTPCPAPCSKLPCHARNDVRRPHEVTRDRSLAYTHAKVRQAHRERTCRAPGGVAGLQRTSLSYREQTSRAPGGVAVSPCAWRISTGRECLCRTPGGVA
jgi:hypothetical protein